MSKHATFGAPSSIAEANQARIARLLHQCGILSRAYIAKALGLTAPAISKLVARMIESGLVTETGDLPGARHRRSIGLALKTAAYRVIGVKFARSRVDWGVFDLAGKPLQQGALPLMSDRDIPGTVQAVTVQVNQVLAADPSIIAVGMAVPGPYLRHEGRIALVTSMQGWRGVNFLNEFSQAFPVPTFIEQDARAGALAQNLFAPDHRTPRLTGPNGPAARPTAATNLAYYLVGEGVGLGVIESGRLINGERGGATELGHVSIDVNGRPCECGNRGCLERYCSAVAIHETMCAPEYSGSFPQVGGLDHAQACQLLFQRAAQGDEPASELLERVCTCVGYGCVSIINAFNPSRIVIGDLVAGAGRPLLDTVRRIVSERALPELRQSTRICLSSLPADATLLGAAAVAVDRFLQAPTAYASLSKQRAGKSGHKPVIRPAKESQP
ncbi:N-acetylglucosamine repressor [Bifidobacterium actinocoloniiforme DSM 22766]|uniref:N-acetylglucosamine repressor n=1 Tax=Bifidobacterium actinocoloniiforme DSM 22766 TaxID=1437605 RepID=A0A086Z0Z9_9BIFI|nr:ROK family transcriptional regulator [Bifidobacterium actinocoloniiforme]KFI40199.1 N-acetylglucosamine repressor [Bifidobacterium actinocoloniiforme DSM 22766]